MRILRDAAFKEAPHVTRRGSRSASRAPYAIATAWFAARRRRRLASASAPRPRRRESVRRDEHLFGVREVALRAQEGFG